MLKHVLTCFRIAYQPSNFPTGRLGAFEGVWRATLASLCLAAALMTYFAGRAVPLILIGFLIYLLIFQRAIFKHLWWRYLLAIGIAALIALPMFIEIAHAPGGEKRTEVVGGPLIELRKGNVRPAIDTTLGTLGMFTFAGDPEWLYNVEHRPVFDWITGVFFYLGVLVCLLRLRRVECGFALAWLIVGIAPAFVSIPAASFSHTIAALPVVYMVTAVSAVGVLSWISDKMTRWQDATMTLRRRRILSSLLPVILSLLVALNAWLTIRDYFGTWANEYIVRFQYHAPTREVAQWLNQHPEIADVAVGTNPYQLVLDPLALKLDMPQDIPVSWFNAETALVKPHSGPTLFTALQPPGSEVRQILSDTAPLQYVQPDFEVYSITSDPGFEAYSVVSGPGFLIPRDGAFDQGHLMLHVIGPRPIQVKPGEVLTWRTYWLITPPVSQPRLKIFLHVLSDEGEVISGDDREDLNLSTLNSGDAFWQVSQLTLPNDLPPGQYQVEVGWYNPETDERLKRDDGSDRLLLPLLEVIAP